jgi:hypothetical protein
MAECGHMAIRKMPNVSLAPKLECFIEPVVSSRHRSAGEIAWAAVKLLEVEKGRLCPQPQERTKAADHDK